MFDGLRPDRIPFGDPPSTEDHPTTCVTRRTITSFYHSPPSVVFLLSSGEVFLIPSTRTSQIVVISIGTAPPGTTTAMMSNDGQFLYFQTSTQTSVHVVINNASLSPPLAVIDTPRTVVNVSPTGLVLVSPNGVKHYQLVTSQPFSGLSGNQQSGQPSVIDKNAAHALRPTLRLSKAVPLSGVSSGSFVSQYNSKMFNGVPFVTPSSLSHEPSSSSFKTAGQGQRGQSVDGGKDSKYAGGNCGGGGSGMNSSTMNASGTNSMVGGSQSQQQQQQQQQSQQQGQQQQQPIGRMPQRNGSVASGLTLYNATNGSGSGQPANANNEGTRSKSKSKNVNLSKNQSSHSLISSGPAGSAANSGAGAGAGANNINLGASASGNGAGLNQSQASCANGGNGSLCGMDGRGGMGVLSASSSSIPSVDQAQQAAQQLPMPLAYGVGCRDGKIYLLRNNFDTIAKLGDLKSSISTIHSAILPVGDLTGAIPELVIVGAVSQSGILSFFSNVSNTDSPFDATNEHVVSPRFRVCPDAYISIRNETVIVTNRTKKFGGDQGEGGDNKKPGQRQQQRGGRAGAAGGSTNKWRGGRIRRTGVTSNSSFSDFSIMSDQISPTTGAAGTDQGASASSSKAVPGSEVKFSQLGETVPPVQMYTIKIVLWDKEGDIQPDSIASQQSTNIHGAQAAQKQKGKLGAQSQPQTGTAGFPIKAIDVSMICELTNLDLKIPPNENVVAMFSIDVVSGYELKMVESERKDITRSSSTTGGDGGGKEAAGGKEETKDRRKGGSEVRLQKKDTKPTIANAFMIVTDYAAYIMRGMEINSGYEFNNSNQSPSGMIRDIITPRFECLKAFCVSLYNLKTERGTARQQGRLTVRGERSGIVLKSRQKPLSLANINEFSKPGGQSFVSPPRLMEDKGKKSKKVRIKSRIDGQQRKLAMTEQMQSPMRIMEDNNEGKVDRASVVTKSAVGTIGGESMEKDVNEGRQGNFKERRPGSRGHHNQGIASPTALTHSTQAGQPNKAGVQLPPI